MVADDVLQLREDLEELVVAHLRVATDVLEPVDHLRFQFDQRLDGHFIDFLEGFAVYVLEVLCLELLNEFGIGSLKVGLANGAVLIEFEALSAHLLMQELLELVLGDVSFLQEALEHQLLLFFPGGMRPEQDIHIEDVTGRVVFIVLFETGTFQLMVDVFDEQFTWFDSEGLGVEAVHLHGITDLLHLDLVLMLIVEDVSLQKELLLCELR